MIAAREPQGWLLGGGYWVTRSMLAKLEAVYQSYDHFGRSDGPVSGADAWHHPAFFGLLMEFSLAY